MTNYKGNGGFMIKGGIDIPADIDQFPNSKYWAGGAQWAKAEIFKLTPDEWQAHIENVLRGIWNDEYTWRDICMQTEMILDCIKVNSNLVFVGKPATHPTYDQLIRGAQFTNQHRTDDRNWWNEYFSDEAVQARQQTNELRAG